MNFNFYKRNDNGQTICCICNKLTWDCFCYDLHVDYKELFLFKCIICNDCYYKLKK